MNRNIDGAARDVQAAINAARANLPSNLPQNPTWRKVNPADAPILIVALTSDIYSRGQLYDAASTIMQQRLLQIEGVGQVNIGGGALPGVRVEINPTQLNNTGLSLEDVRAMLSQQNANTPKGQLSDQRTTADILANDQLFKAKEYAPLIVAYRNGAPVSLSDVATVRGFGREHPCCRLPERQGCHPGGHISSTGREYHPNCGSSESSAAVAQSVDPCRDQHADCARSDDDDSCLGL